MNAEAYIVTLDVLSKPRKKAVHDIVKMHMILDGIKIDQTQKCANQMIKLINKGYATLTQQSGVAYLEFDKQIVDDDQFAELLEKYAKLNKINQSDLPVVTFRS